MGKHDHLTLGTKKFRLQKDFWLAELAGLADEPILPLSLAEEKPRETGPDALQSLEYAVEAEVASLLLKQGKNSDLGLYVLFLSAFTGFLTQYTGKDDILVAMAPIPGDQSEPGPNDLLVLRQVIPEGTTGRALIYSVKSRFLQILENRDYPFEKIVEDLRTRTGSDYSFFFDLILLCQNLHPIESIVKIHPNSLTVVLERIDRAIHLCFRYRPSQVDEGLVKDIHKYFSRMLALFVQDVDRELSGIDILSDQEREQILLAFNHYPLEYPQDQTLDRLIAEQVERTPDRIAVAGPAGDFITYRCLDRAADRLAAFLQAQGAAPGSIVGLQVERSTGMIVGILGILKAGAAYLPIDPFCPPGRKDYMLADTGAEIVIDYLSDLTPQPPLQAWRGGEWPGPASYPVPERSDVVSLSNRRGADIAYIIYTSGSTGRPKGIVVEHRQVVNLVYGLEQRIYRRFDHPLNVALLAPCVFDASVQQIFAALAGGHSLFIVPEEARMDGWALLVYFTKNRIEVADGTPGHLRLILNQPDTGPLTPHLKHLVIGGEALARDVAAGMLKKFPGQGLIITNVYGPSECCVDSTGFDVGPENIDHYRTIPIGRPMPNEQVLILNRRLNLVPVGSIGEIHIGGHGVSRGYLNNPELTVERFVTSPPGPLSKIGEGENRGDQYLSRSPSGVEGPSKQSPTTHHSPLTTRFYKTGDLGRWLPDGNIEFCGRIDTQVKIRGFRIELSEIESQLRAIDYILEAAVIVKDLSGDKYLCAYLVSEREIDVADIRDYLQKHLPTYMIPPYFMQVYRLPLTANGKLDQRALPEPNLEISRDFQPPADGFEGRMAALWAEVLACNREAIGRNSHFFEIGGHSLRATSLVSRIHREFEVKILLADVFEHPTLQALSEYVMRMDKKEGFSSLPQAEKKEYYELSSAQKRIYLLHHLLPDNLSYNMPQKLETDEALEKDKIETVFRQLIQRHESLRTSFALIGDFPVQRIDPAPDFDIEYVDLNSPVGQAGQTEPGAIVQDFLRPFDLSHAPLLRARLIKTRENRSILLVDMHHIISDAVSDQILVKDFTALYRGESLPPLKLQYKDYSEWQNRNRESPEMKRQETFWLNKFAGEIPRLNMPTDFPRPQIQDFAGDEVLFEIGPGLLARIRGQVSFAGVTLHIFLLAAYTILLSRYSGQADIVVGTVVAGRPQADTENIIGFFVNMLPLRNTAPPGSTFQEFLQAVKRDSIEAYENQDYPYDELIARLGIRREADKQPLVETSLVLQNTASPGNSGSSPGLPGQDESDRAFRNDVSHFDFWLMAVESGDSVQMMFKYSVELFKRSTIERMAGHWLEILDQVTVNRDIQLGAVALTHDLLAAGVPAFDADQDSFAFTSPSHPGSERNETD